MTVREIASKLDIKPEELEKESLKVYLTQRLRHLESEIFRIGSKHGVKDIFQMDELIKGGKIHEDGSWEDFFILDNLEAERRKIQGILESLG
ncbi:MAG: hypothetical protein KKC39_06055 [Candidatus Omnitrophica bacterium]|nr:hypothetical protein [Candidatus Omnitrophota bacterium]MBU4468280.1 hypothetical protein [Candidatus Omnitrophota bacterium]MCG2708587.1 hypothetical protein [Candidatus Omnitrophota bacterium]